MSIKKITEFETTFGKVPGGLAVALSFAVDEGHVTLYVSVATAMRDTIADLKKANKDEGYQSLKEDITSAITSMLDGLYYGGNQPTGTA